MSTGENGTGKGPCPLVFPTPDLSADDLIRIFNDPEGELLEYAFNPAMAPKCQANDIFCMYVPYDAIKRLVQKVRKDIFDHLDPEAKAPDFQHAGSTSIKGTAANGLNCSFVYEFICPNWVCV